MQILKIFNSSKNIQIHWLLFLLAPVPIPLHICISSNLFTCASPKFPLLPEDPQDSIAQLKSLLNFSSNHLFWRYYKDRGTRDHESIRHVHIQARLEREVKDRGEKRRKKNQERVPDEVLSVLELFCFLTPNVPIIPPTVSLRCFFSSSKGLISDDGVITFSPGDWQDRCRRYRLCSHHGQRMYGRWGGGRWRVEGGALCLRAETEAWKLW